MISDKINPFQVFLSAFGVSSFAGLAALLRAGKPLTPLSVISAVLNSGMLGLGIVLIWYAKFQDNIYFLIGVCVLAGLGGATMVDFFVAAFRSGGLSLGGIKVNFQGNAKEEDEEVENKKP